MLHTMLRLLLALALTACATTRPAMPTERVLDSGGELQLSALPDPSVTRDDVQLVAFALAEVPGDSRLQAALAIADAQARAELLKAVRVGIASALSAHTDGASQTVNQATAEVASGVLPALPPPSHSWRKIERDGAVVLQVFSRVTADRKAVDAALSKALADPELAQRAAALIGEGVTP